jgi:HTH-type transcriptional regulator, sugar sensing transcriptional regulator
MSLESSLSRAGLTPKEVKVYLACLQLGSATMTQISKNSEIKRSSTYLIVESLQIKGFLSSFKKDVKTYYAPEPPQKLLNLIRAREREVESILPELEVIYNEPKEKPRIKIYEGIEALKQIYDELYDQLGKKEEALWFTSIGDLEKNFPEAIDYYLRQLKKKRDYRIRELNVGDSHGMAHAKRMKKIKGPNHHIRTLDPKNSFSNTDNLIFGDKLVIFSIRKDLFVIMIENKNIADTYRAIFNAAWQTGKEV